MPLSRISDLTAGTIPIAGTSLFEVSVANAGAPSGYDSRKFTLANLFTSPVFTGTPTFPTGTIGVTQAAAANDTTLATTAFVKNQGSAPLASPTFSGAATIPNLIMQGVGTGQTAIKFYQPGAPLDQKTWEILVDGSSIFGIRAVNDAYSLASYAFQISRGTSYNVGVATFSCATKISVPDGPQQLIVAGTTRAARFTAQSGDFKIEGTDPTGSGSYQPLSLGGSVVNLLISGTAKATLDALGNFTASNDITANQSFFTLSSGDAGASTTRGFFSGRRWRFKQNAGDDSAAGSIDYRGYDASALSIVGAGGTPRLVRIYDDMTVTGWLTASGATVSGGNDSLRVVAANGGYGRLLTTVTGQRTWSTGTITNGNYQIADETQGVGRLQIDSFGQIHVYVHIFPESNNYSQCGTGGQAWNNVWSYAFGNASGRSEKDDIIDMPSGALDRLKALRAVNFRWRNNPNDERNRIQSGFIADEVAKVFGVDWGGYECVERDGKQHEGIQYNQLVAVLWSAVQELSAQVQELKSRVIHV